MPRKRLYYTAPRGSAWHHRSDRCIPPVRPVCMGSTRRHQSDQSQQNRGAAHSAPKGATRQNSSLGGLAPPLPTPSASLRINLTQQGQKSTSECPGINWIATNPEQLILSKTYPTSGYNLAHIPRYVRLLAGGYFAEKATKLIPYFQYFSLRLYMNSINSNLIFAGLYLTWWCNPNISMCPRLYIYT